jgi:mono/diheme cytochrome c family protein
MPAIWKKRMLLLLFSTVTVILLSGCGAPEGDIQEGQRWYTMHNCYSCHGKNANDGKAAKIASLDMGFSSFVRLLRNPSSPSMPRFPETTLSKEDAADIYAWLKNMPQ